MIRDQEASEFKSLSGSLFASSHEGQVQLKAQFPKLVSWDRPQQGVHQRGKRQEFLKGSLPSPLLLPLTRVGIFKDSGSTLMANSPLPDTFALQVLPLKTAISSHWSLFLSSLLTPHAQLPQNGRVTLSGTQTPPWRDSLHTNSQGCLLSAYLARGI